MKSFFLFLFVLIGSWWILSAITGEYEIENIIGLLLFYLAVKIVIRVWKEVD
ncbi:hypothetical protein SAMN05421670_0463 [Psychrobacillus psychrotolerans]|uniref:Uncharacterized protein n=1 Tax=Psychrobacillus psychrotolerans TaxID=126156 RepID=A0A1I5UN43_9BACI|nr:hypothetical protein [Psychrobacillus psychrotolerans]SFP96640.1 hypothetical protein SAMN05421670_0463 [Psychrobacillus psychrotolerans]